jgi:hypothetical protein
MAKTLAGVLAVSIAALLFAGCGRQGDSSGAVTTTTLAVTTTTLAVSPPSAPVGLVAGETSVCCSLTWSAPENDGGSKIIQYNLQRSDDGINWTYEIVKPMSEYATSSTYSFVSYRGSWEIRISATNVAGTGPYASLIVGDGSPVEPKVSPETSRLRCELKRTLIGFC